MKIRLTEKELIKFIQRVIKEQDEFETGMMSRLVNCRGKKWRATLSGGASGGGGGSSFEPKDSWDDLTNKKSYTEDDKNAMIQSFKDNFDVIPKEIVPPGLTPESNIKFKDLPEVWIAACREANRYNSAFRDGSKDKYYDEVGNLKQQYQRIIENFDRHHMFYRKFFAKTNEVSPVDILNVYIEKLGGIDKFKSTVNNFYKTN